MSFVNYDALPTRLLIAIHICRIRNAVILLYDLRHTSMTLSGGYTQQTSWDLSFQLFANCWWHTTDGLLLR